MHRLASFAALAVLTGCSTSPATTSDGGVPRDTPPRADTGPTELVVGSAARPATVIFPTAHDGTTDLPLIVLLHGYGASGAIQDAYLGVSRATRTRGAYLLVPDGTVDTSGSRFWNATDACCDFGGTDVDDVGYLLGLVDEAEARLPIDPTRIYFMGHSNGGFMSYRMACEASERIAAIAPLAGVDFLDPDACVPTMPVSVLHWHGTADETIAYEGTAGYPSALVSVERWATRAGCTMPGVSAGTIDMSTSIDGAETLVTEWTAGCTAGTSFALYRMEGEGHIPNVSRDGIGGVIDWLLTHRR